MYTLALKVLAIVQVTRQVEWLAIFKNIFVHIRRRRYWGRPGAQNITKLGYQMPAGGMHMNPEK